MTDVGLLVLLCLVLQHVDLLALAVLHDLGLNNSALHNGSANLDSALLANSQNLITGTRYLNVTGMLPFENMVADYVKETNNHVLYRVTPIFDGTDLVARGVLMEAWSVEDNGEGICFNVYCYNVQPGVEIDYATGDNWAA